MPAARVQKGETVTTGDSSYDAFFKQVSETREEAQKAEKDAEGARTDLVKALELDPKAATDDAIVEQVVDRAKKLQDRGVLLHLELTPEAKLLSVLSKPLDPWGEDTLKAIEVSAGKSLALTRRLSELSSRAAGLQKKRGELTDKAASTFGSRSEDIVRELHASEQVLGAASDLGLRYAGLTSRFVLSLASAVETGAGGSRGSFRFASTPEKPQKKPQGKAQGRPAGSQSGPTSPASVPARKPKPKSDDFEP